MIVAVRSLASESAARRAAPFVALLPAAALLAQDATRVHTLATGLALAIPALASLAVLSAALTANLKGGSAIGGLFDPICVAVRAIGLGVIPAVGRVVSLTDHLAIAHDHGAHDPGFGQGRSGRSPPG